MKHRKRTQVRRARSKRKIKGGKRRVRRTRSRRKTKGGKRQVRKRTRVRRKIKGGVNWRMTPILGNRAARRAAEAEEARRAAAAAEAEEAEEARRAAEAEEARHAWEKIPASKPPQVKSGLAKLMSGNRGQDWKDLNNEHKQMGIEEQRQLDDLENPWKGGQDGEKSLANLLKRSEERRENRTNPALWAAQQEKFARARARKRELARRAPPPSRLGQMWNAVKK